MPERFTIEEVRCLLREECEAAGGQQAFAREHGLSQAVVSLILTGRRDPQPSVLRVLGLRRIVMFEAEGGECD